MAEPKKSFVLYCDWIHTVEKLPDESAGQLLKHLLRYVNGEDPKTDNILIELAFEPVKQQLKRDESKYENVRNKKVIAGIAGAKKRWQTIAHDSNRKHKVAKMAVNVNDNVSDTINNIYGVNDFVKLFNERLGSRYTATDKVRGSFNARLSEKYTPDDFSDVINNALADDYHKKTKYKYVTPEFLLRPDKFQKFLNQSTNPKDRLPEGYTKHQLDEIERQRKYDQLVINYKIELDWGRIVNINPEYEKRYSELGLSEIPICANDEYMIKNFPNEYYNPDKQG